jgi:IS605 OrfB family transposase
LTDSSLFTYQTRLNHLTREQVRILDEYCALHSKLERKLCAAIKSGNYSRNELKRQFIAQHKISARMFGSIAKMVDGKMNSIKELLPKYIRDTKAAIHQKQLQIQRDLKKQSLNSKQLFVLHQKRRRLGNLQNRLARLQAQWKNKKFTFCFGTRKLFRAQYHLDANGYQDHAEWLKEWRNARSNQFIVIGSKDERMGNMLCQMVEKNGVFALRLRLPEALNLGKYLEIDCLDFQYGKENLQNALRSSHRRLNDQGTAIIYDGSALTYRFERDEKGYRLFVSTNVKAPKVISNRNIGALGIDINTDHLAVSEIDYRGNWIGSQKFDLCLRGKKSHQVTALIGDQVKQIIEIAKVTSKPIVIEQLDFQKKKTEFSHYNPKYARTLSSFAYNKIIQTIKAAAFRAGIKIIEVNPAYTSIIGAVNYAQQYGISTHQAAAIAIARRSLGFSEKLTSRNGLVPMRNGSHVTFTLPVRNREKHVWNYWSGIRKSILSAHKEHMRSGNSKSNPKPLRYIRPLGSSYCIVGMRFPYASRTLLLDGEIDSIIPF